jgi:hypothetical protein
MSKDYFFVPVLNSLKHQDKEVRKKSKINEENTFKDSVLELSDFYNSEHWLSDHMLFYDLWINDAAVEI